MFVMVRAVCRTAALLRASAAAFLATRSGRTLRATSDHKCSSSVVSVRWLHERSNFGADFPPFIGSLDATHVRARTERESIPASIPDGCGPSLRLVDGAARRQAGPV